MMTTPEDCPMVDVKSGPVNVPVSSQPWFWPLVTSMGIAILSAGMYVGTMKTTDSSTTATIIELRAMDAALAAKTETISERVVRLEEGSSNIKEALRSIKDSLDILIKQTHSANMNK